MQIHAFGDSKRQFHRGACRGKVRRGSLGSLPLSPWPRECATDLCRQLRLALADGGADGRQHRRSDGHVSGARGGGRVGRGEGETRGADHGGSDGERQQRQRRRQQPRRPHAILLGVVPGFVSGVVFSVMLGVAEGAADEADGGADAHRHVEAVCKDEAVHAERAAACGGGGEVDGGEQRVRPREACERLRRGGGRDEGLGYAVDTHQADVHAVEAEQRRRARAVGPRRAVEQPQQQPRVGGAESDEEQAEERRTAQRQTELRSPRRVHSTAVAAAAAAAIGAAPAIGASQPRGTPREVREEELHQQANR
eukprot:1355285-Pleurochrysis_carterae.AAC.3